MTDATKTQLQAMVIDHQRWLQNESSGRRGDFSHYDLTGWSLEAIRLSRAILKGACLMGAKLKDADLSYANLFMADLEGADLRDANLRGADLRGARLRRADLTNANLEGVNLATGSSSGDVEETGQSRYGVRAADLTESKARGVVLINATLSECDLSGVDLRGADLSGANLTNSILVHAQLSDIRTEGTRFEGAFTFGAEIDEEAQNDLAARGAHFTLDGREVDLPGVIAAHLAWLESDGKDGLCADLDLRSLRGADLAGCDLRSARMRRCDLRSSNFAGAKLMMADFTGSNLAGAILSDANLSGCSFRSANLFDCRFDRARLVPMTIDDQAEPWPTSFENAQLHLASFAQATLRQVILRGVRLNADTVESLRSSGVPASILRRLTIDRTPS